MIKNKLPIIILLGLFASSCVNMSQQPTTVSRSDVQKQQSITLGTIIDITNVTIEGDRRLGAAAVRQLVELLVKIQLILILSQILLLFSEL